MELEGVNAYCILSFNEFFFPTSGCWEFVLFFISTSFIMLNFIGRCGDNIIWYHFFYIIIIILKSQFLYIFFLF